ncbi:MAG: ATP synthase F1 subunit epsilon [Pseudomonadota bacterium]|jgi:ATP synthase F1 epsilon subunit|nr:ATP synthase F1 subunit epsilon [Pseudomonadota bacterium]|tara:strand:+ start:189 stop:584 length:396 start_codon:yes stop_codon:yes gene_type:complete
MTNKFELSVISAESKVFEGEVENVLVPGMVGDFLVLPNHAPCISSIRPGFLEFSDGSSSKHRYFVSGGIIEVINNTVSLLVDKAVTGDKDIKEDISTLISGIDEKLAIADITDKDDLGLRKNDLEEALKQV